MDSIRSLMEEYTWRSLLALLGPDTRVAGVAVFCRAMASEDDAISPNAAEHKAAAICLLILRSPSNEWGTSRQQSASLFENELPSLRKLSCSDQVIRA